MKENSGTALPLELEVGRTVSQFYWTMRSRYNELLSPFGLSVEQWRILLLLSYSEGCEQRTIACQTMKAKSGITTLLARMGREGLVAKVTDEKDARNKKVYLTEKGRMLADQGKTIIFAENKRLFQEVDIRELEAAIGVLKKLTDKCRGAFSEKVRA